MKTRQPKTNRRLVPIPQPATPTLSVPSNGIQFTARQWQVLEFIKAFREAHPYGPTLRDFCHGIGVVHSVAAHHVEILIERNALQVDRVGRKHSIRTGSLRLAPHIAELLEQREMGQ